MLPEIAIRPQKSSRHVRDHIFPLFGADWLGAHLRVFVVFVVEHEFSQPSMSFIANLP
jgi:hypothetical protein